METLFWIGFIGAALAGIYALLQAKRVKSFSEGTERMKKIAAAIREGANAYLASGRMCKPIGYRCGSVTFPLRKGGETTMPSVLSTAWESADGSRVQLFVNHTDDAVRVETDDGRVLTVPPLDGVSVTL